MNTYKAIDQLSVNKTVVFRTLLQGDDKMVRTGTIGDGSCAFHAFLHAFSPEYVSNNSKNRAKIVKKYANQ